MRSPKGELCLQSGWRRSMRQLALLLASCLLLVPVNRAFAQGNHSVSVSPPVTPYSFSGDLSKLPKGAASNANAPVPQRIKAGTFNTTPRPLGPPDPVWQKDPAGHGAGRLTPGVTPPQFTTPSPNFDTGQPGDGPPDDNGAVGPNHYIAIVNFTYQIFDKQGNSLAGPINPATFWSGAPVNDQCRNQRGDPYVNYDHLADRWVISYFANIAPPPPKDPLQVECIAVSKGPNPVTDGWFVYTFLLPVSNDYPKIGVWPDGYYMISQEGYDNGAPNLDAWVFDRANMLNGNPATFQHSQNFSGEHDVIALPSDLTGPPPPAGSPNFFARQYDGNLYSDGAPRIEIFEFHTDWGVPGNSTFGLVQTLTPATFRSDICSGNALNQYCVPQPGSGTTLDALSIWPMGPLQYRNFGTYETLVFDHAVNVDGAGLVGMRWYELRRTPPGSGSWVIQQQGTFAPADSTTTTTTSIHRWTGSIAMDQAGNIAMGYNVSSDGVAPHPTVDPGVRIVGRLAGDPPGEMTTPEVHLADGGSTCGNGGGNCRWGDYSTIRVDPKDGCTFWYTTEYFAGSGQQTRVGAVRFPTCNPADLSLSKSAPASVIAGNQLTYSITVVNNGPSDATNVIVTDTLPAGVTFISTSAVCSSGTVTTGCDIGSLANGASYAFTILVSVASSTAGLITNTATVSSDQLDPNPSDDTASATTTVTASADLSVTKTCKPDTTSALAGTTAFCTMVVTNNGPSDASGVSLTDTIVASTPFTIGTVTKSQGTCSATPGTITSGSVTCSLGTITAGGTATVTVNFSANSGGTIEDTASVTSSTPDPNSANNTATGAVTYISVADLSITKTALPNPNVVAGTNLTYTITASNTAGPSTATNVVVKDTLPGQVSVVSVTPGVGTCSGGIPGNPAQPLICTLGSLAKGASATITVVVTVNPNTPNGTILTNNASISSDTFDPNNANNTASVNKTVVAQGDLAIVKTSDKAIYKPTSTITYTIKVTNNGPSDSQAVIVTDSLPSIKQAHYKSDTGGCTLTLATNVLTCNLGTMPTGTTKSFHIYELIVGNKGSISNTASVASSTTDPTPGNNSSTLVVGVK